MFSAVLLVTDDTACADIERLALDSKQVSFVTTVFRIPASYELNKIFNMHSPDLVFLDLSDWDLALTAAAEIRELSPRTGVIGFGAGWNAGHEAQIAAAGITELVSPVTLKKFQDCVDQAIHRTVGGIQENLFAFLPSKAGSGSTTIALNTAGYMARAKTVLLIDGDLNSGVVSLLLDSSHPYSLRDALEGSAQLDYSQWTKFVTKSHGVDFLLSGRRRGAPLPSWSNYHHLLDFAATRYDSILVDLPEVVNDATVETVRRAKRVFIVCTPEMPSLALAPNRCEELISRGISADKISLIVNRWHKREISASELEETLKYPVAATFGNDYGAVSKAARAHGLVSVDTRLGKSFADFAANLAGEREVRATSPVSFWKGLGARVAPPSHV